MTNEFKNLLSEEIVGYYDFIVSLKNSKAEWKYFFMPDDEFLKIKDPFRSTKIYWEEMLYRTHIVVLVSLFKSIKWFDAINNNSTNYFGFCASLRSLIESCADSFYTLRGVPLTLANDYKAIYESINRESPIIVSHPKLQATLLHFIQATKLTNEQKKQYPLEFNAKQTTEYLACFNEDNEEIISLYKYLCGISHPAYEANAIFLFLHNGETIVCGDSDKYESVLIQNLLENRKEYITRMYRTFMINILGTLNLLNYFDIPEIKTNFAKGKNFEDHALWKEIDEKMKMSFDKYQNELKNVVFK